MSKKETEFDRYDRMKKMERESEVQKRKNVETLDLGKNKKGGKAKSENETVKKRRVKDYAIVVEDEYDYV